MTAFAKLTLSLHITGVRSDGYHELDAVMVSVAAPADTLTIAPSAAPALTITGTFADGVPADATNLAWRAATACGASVAMHLDKGIPSGAGLGGGSADAAAVLVALGGDAALGATLGADVPFCMHGGAARVRGIGDVVEAVSLPPQSVVIATPPFSCVTADVYRAWDALGGPHAPGNDLEPAAWHVEPRLEPFRHAVERAAGAPAVLAGSGSSYALVFDDPVAADAARQRIDRAVDAAVWSGAAGGPGVVVEP